MNFYEVLTTYRHVKAERKKRGLKFHETVDSFYREVQRLAIEGRIRDANGTSADLPLTYQGERLWYSIGEPYYKVFPRMASMMSEVSIDIPARDFLMPYPVFAILLADSPDNDFQEFEGAPRLKWVLVQEFKAVGLSDGKFKMEIGDYRTVGNLMSGSDRAIFIHYEFTGDFKGSPNRLHYILSLRNEGSLEALFDTSYESTAEDAKAHFQPGEYCPGKEMCHRIVKLAIATAFFGIDCHEMVMPDLPRRVIEHRKFQHRGNERSALKSLKSERHNTKHWTIGREISLPLPIREYKDSEAREHKELTHGYLRRGHMRWQVCGEERKERKLIFIHPHMVRPDLPLATSHGYRIPDRH